MWYSYIMISMKQIITPREKERRRKLVIRQFKHGHSGSGDRKRPPSPTYYTWMGMIGRCKYTANPSYPNYGGSGIKVCKRWSNFQAFLKDMGERPIGKTLDRINTLADYKPGNCRWATPSEQQRNKISSKKITANGITLLLIEWSEKLKIPQYILWNRTYRGWSDHKTINTPVGKWKRKL